MEQKTVWRCAAWRWWACWPPWCSFYLHRHRHSQPPGQGEGAHGQCDVPFERAFVWGACRGLAAGIGSGLFDLMDPAWAPEFWITAINKFAMAFVAGTLAKKLPLNRHAGYWVAGVAGAVSYCVLYVSKNILSGHFIKGFAWNVAILETVTVKLPVTLVNALIAVVCSVLLAEALRPALKRAGLFRGALT